MNRLIYFPILLSMLLLVACADTKPPGEQKEKSKKQPLFTLLGYQQTGINFVNKLRETPEVNVLTFKYFSNGGGVSIGDINNDGLPDVYLTGNLGPNMLFLNQGNLQFKDITRSAGVDGGRGWTNGATMVDINSDGFLDIYVSRSGKLPEEMRANQFFINNGDLTFTNKAKELGLADPSYSTQATFFDYDLDNDLDMYLLNHNIQLAENLPLEELKNNKDPLVGDKLYRNDNGKFTDVSDQSGISQNSIGYGLGVGVGDLNEDGFPDIYVCNDFLEQDYMYINNRNGTFTDQLKTSVGHTSNFSMGCDIADYNNDGKLDILVTDMAAEDNFRSKTNMSGMNPEKFWNAVDKGFHYQYMVNTLQLNRGDLKFSEVGQLAGISYTDWSWAPLFADFDNDGHKDIFITNGYRKASRNNDFLKKKDEYYRKMAQQPAADQKRMIGELLAMMPEDNLPNYVYKNDGDLTFTKKTREWGMSTPSFSNGAAIADLDNDGDLDVVVNNIDQACHVYRNNSEQSANNYLSIELNGAKSNPTGIGARIELTTTSDLQVIEFNPSRGYLSSMDHQVHFGLGNSEKIERLVIKWPDQKKQVLTNVEPNQLLIIDYKEAIEFIHDEGSLESLFEDMTGDYNIAFLHKENEFDDFEKEVLLPHKMSSLGPGLAVADVNGDGLEDFYVGNAKGQSGSMYLQQSDGRFRMHQKSMLGQERSNEDMGAAFFDLENDGDKDLYLASGGYQFEDGDGLYRDKVFVNDLNQQKVVFSQKARVHDQAKFNSSCVVPEDFDNDGYTDLFVGGRAKPGAYPYAERSMILKNDNGRLKDVTQQIAPALLQAGMVTSATWADVNDDGSIDLIIVGEWMEVTILLNEDGRFTKATQNGLENTSGWWYSIQHADLDNDGDLDLIAGNLGLNYKYKASDSNPFHVYAGDFDGTGTEDIYLGYAQDGKVYPVRGRECSSQQMPFVKEKFATYNDFGSATLTEVLGESIQSALHYEAQTFASVWLENDGNGNFTIHQLPIEAQFSSINAIITDDINNDDLPDLIIAGNLYGSEVETPRNDAGYGLVMLNEGNGGFRVLDLPKSGFIAGGDVKDMAKIKLADGSTGILIARNNGPLSLFKKISDSGTLPRNFTKP